MFASKKQLREQVDRMKLEFGEYRAIVAELRKTITSLEGRNAELESLAKDNAALSGEVTALKKQIAEQQKDIRKQTEADLLLNALQAVGIADRPKPPQAVDHFARAKDGKLCNINTTGDNWMDVDARPFICTTCKVIKRTKAGLIQVAMETDPTRTYSFPEKNVDILPRDV